MPGAGLPLEYIPDYKDEAFVREHLPNPLLKDDIDFCGFDLTTLREISMLNFMNAITDKAEWYKKVTDESICAKWKAEVQSTVQDFTDTMFEHSIQELRHRASRFDPTTSSYGGAVAVLMDTSSSPIQPSQKTCVASYKLL